MYCSSCGKPNPDDANFCVSCGAPLQIRSRTPSASVEDAQSFNARGNIARQLHAISGTSFIVIGLLFLLPFISVQCGEQKIITVSGTELVTGGVSLKFPSFDTSQENQVGNGERKSKPNIFATVAILSVGCGALFSFFLRGKNLRVAVVSFGAIASAALLGLHMDLNSRIDQHAKAVLVRLNFEAAYWVCLIAPIVLIVLVLALGGARQTREVLGD